VYSIRLSSARNVYCFIVTSNIDCRHWSKRGAFDVRKRNNKRDNFVLIWKKKDNIPDFEMITIKTSYGMSTQAEN
jgi:hypothetical protein